MEQYVGKSDYEKTREDALSFKAGDRFHVASKTDSKWWSVYAVSTGDRGYVPSDLLEVGRLSSAFFYFAKGVAVNT